MLYFCLLLVESVLCVLKMCLLDTGFSEERYMGLLEMHPSLEPTAAGQVLPVI